MSFDFSKLLFTGILRPRYFLAVAIGTAALLWSPDEFVSQLGLSRLLESLRGWIGLAFLASIVLLIGHGLATLGTASASRLHNRSFIKEREKFLHHLSPDEKRILSEFMSNSTKTQYFDITDGVAAGLERQGILYRPTNVGFGHSMALNLQPFAWHYLRKRPHVLVVDE